MTLILAAGRRFDVDAVVFDKDGTLLDFDRLWTARTVRWVETLAAMAQEAGPVAIDSADPGARPSSAHLADALCRAMGFDAQRAAFVPDGPMAVASMNDIYALAAGVLFQCGIDWHEGRPMAVRAATGTIAAPPDPAEVRPRGDVKGLIRRLRAAGVQVAVATNDERILTEAMLAQLEIAGDVARMVCGDDAFPPKPDPAGLCWLATQLDITSERLAMVGDSANDMVAGRNAGVGACIGVAGGAGKRHTLARYADIVLDGVGEIEVVDT